MACRLVCLIAVALVVMASRPDASGAQSPFVFTIAGVESMGATAPAVCDADPCPAPDRLRQWVATDRRLNGPCLGHLADGRVLLCDGSELLRLDPDGVMRRWPQARGALRTLSGPDGDPQVLQDLDVGPDGTVVVVSDGGAVRVAPDGASSVLIRAGSAPYSRGVDVLPDGSALIAEYVNERVARVSPAGVPIVVAGGGRQTAEGGLATQARLREPAAVSAFADGSFAIAEEGAKRVRVVDTAGRIRTVAGGGRGFVEGAPGTAVDLAEPNTVRALDDGSLLIASQRGVLRLDPEGRIHTVVRGLADGEGFLPVDARQLTSSGGSVTDAALLRVENIDVLPDGSLLALSDVPEGGVRLAQFASVGETQRLAVALAPNARTTARRGFVEVLSTRPASATIEAVRGVPRVVAARTRVRLEPGRNRVALRVARSGEVHELRLTARASDGAQATHRLTFIPDTTLSRRALRALTNFVDINQSFGDNSFDTEGCHRVAPRRFTCRWFATGVDDSASGRASFTLRRDGLIGWTLRGGGKPATRILLEPVSPLTLPQL